MVPAADLVHATGSPPRKTKMSLACPHPGGRERPDWLIVDHLARSTPAGERDLAPNYRNLMVIDDLADRHHACDLLLDQTFRSRRRTIVHWCRPLQHAMWLAIRLAAPSSPPAPLACSAAPNRPCANGLTTMGGVDKDNATGQGAAGAANVPLSADRLGITVVLAQRRRGWTMSANRRRHAMDDRGAG